MDSVAVSIASGVKYKNINMTATIKISLFFELFQGSMPLIGYSMGSIFATLVDKITSSTTCTFWSIFNNLTLFGASFSLVKTAPKVID